MSKRDPKPYVLRSYSGEWIGRISDFDRFTKGKIDFDPRPEYSQDREDYIDSGENESEIGDAMIEDPKPYASDSARYSREEYLALPPAHRKANVYYLPRQQPIGDRPKS